MRNITLILTLFVLGLLPFACSAPGASESGQSPEGVPITTIKPEIRDIVVYYKTSSTIEASDVRTLSFTVGGKVADILKEEGERISKGDILALLDNETYQNALKAAESNLALQKKQHNSAKVQRDVYANQLKDAEIRFEEDKRDYERYKRLYDDNVATKKELEDAEISFERAKISVENAEKALKLSEGAIAVAQDGVDAAQAQRNIAKKNLEDIAITAPFDGTINKKYLEEGSVVSPGIPIFELIADGEQKIESSLPERYLSAVQDGSNVLLTVPNNECEMFPQKITRVHRDINSRTGNFGVTIELTDVNGCLRHGMFAHLNFEVAREDDILSLPVEAVMELSGQNIVYVVENNKAIKTPVETGISSKDYIEITSGLTGNEDVILSGNKYVVNETPVRIIEQVTQKSTSEN